MSVSYTQLWMVVKNQKRSAKKGGSGRSLRKRSVDLLWGSQERPSRGPRPALTLESTVQAGVHVADSEGLAALTMSRLANELGVTTMALYRYVPGKEELVDLMMDVAIGTPPSPNGRAKNWRTELTEWAQANLAVLQQHPWLLELVGRRMPVGPNWLAWVDSALSALSGTGLTPRETIAVVFLIDGHVRSAAQIALGVTGTEQWAADFARVLMTISHDERYSALSGVAVAGGFEQPVRGEVNMFEFGLQRLLDGIESFSRSRAGHGRRVARPTRLSRVPKAD
jgi:AcrR family transcriptional regulator